MLLAALCQQASRQMTSQLVAGSVSQAHALGGQTGQTPGAVDHVPQRSPRRWRTRLRALPATDTAAASPQQRQYSWSYSQTDSSQVNAYAARQVIVSGFLYVQPCQWPASRRSAPLISLPGLRSDTKAVRRRADLLHTYTEWA